MPARQIISLLVLSALIALPAGIANAGEIDVEGRDSRVIINEDGGITIRRTTPRRPTIYAPRTSNGRIRQQSLEQRLRGLRYPQRTRNLCTGRRIVQRSTSRSSSGSASNSTYSSTTTTTCR